MDRLTIRCGNCVGAIKPEDMGTQGILRKLAEYEDLEEQGLLLRLPAPLDGVELFSLDGKKTWFGFPCNVGDIVYALWSVPSETKYIIYPAEVKEICIGIYNLRKTIKYKIEPISFRGRIHKYYTDDFGKLVFLTQEEAEASLEKIKEGENGLD